MLKAEYDTVYNFFFEVERLFEVKAYLKYYLNKIGGNCTTNLFNIKIFDKICIFFGYYKLWDIGECGANCINYRLNEASGKLGPTSNALMRFI